VPLPNAEQITTAFLRQDSEVVGFLGDNVFTVLPANHDAWPAARVTRIGGTADNLLVIDNPLLQIDVWGGPKLLAEQAANAIREAFAFRLPFQPVGGGLLALGPGNNAIGSLRDLPDTTYDPARPRFVLDVRLLTRP
jgi:hypothetical protein